MQFPSLSAIPDRSPYPQTIFLDAVGTLFGVRGSVGEIYDRIARQYGVISSPTELNRCFYQAFKHAPPCIFPGATGAEIPDLEFEWWKALNRQTFKVAGIWEQFADFDRFFRELYAYFTTPAAWEVYPDIIPTLQKWRDLQIELGVLSNFDSRLHQVLTALDLDRYFQSVTISTAVGAAKPQPQIFAAALAKHQCQPSLAWHIGDSWEEDYLGAKSAGLTAIWIDRDRIYVGQPN
jgi:putative hydrolase of the HAD superfamily